MKALIATGDARLDARICRAVRQYGYETVVTGDGEVALEVARVLHPRLTILGRALPWQSGWLVCAKLRLSGHTGAVLLVSAREDAPLAQFVGADAVLPARPSDEELRRALAEVLSPAFCPAVL